MKSKKRTSIAILLISLFVISTFLPYSAKAAGIDPLNITGKSAVLIDAQSGKVLYQKNPDTPLHPASMTKMMTEYLTLEAIKEGKINWDQKTGISEYVFKVSQNRSLSNVYLRRDHQYSVRELYESMVIYSANGSSIALAELIAGSETNFVKMMNEKASKLGLKDYKFVNCTGLNNSDLFGSHPQGTAANEENVMSARATATLAYYLLRDFPEVLKTSSIPVKVFREGTSDQIRMDNWNWMVPGTMYGVYDYQGVDGIKTGSTDLGGFSFTSTAKRNDTRLISVVMKTDSYAARFGETKKMLDYGFSNFEYKELFPSGYRIEGKSEIPVNQGSEKKVQVETQKPAMMVIKKGDEKLYEPSYQFNQSLMKDGALVAPLEKNQIVGSLVLNYKGTEDYGYLTEAIKLENQVSVMTSSSVKKANWFVLLMRAIGEFFTGILKK